MFWQFLASNRPSYISLYHFLLNKVIISHRSEFLLFFFFFCDFVVDLLWCVVLSPTYCGVWLCRLGMTMDDSCGKTYSIGQRHQIMVINMLEN